MRNLFYLQQVKITTFKLIFGFVRMTKNNPANLFFFKIVQNFSIIAKI